MSITDVIRFEGSQEALVWKHPVEDFHALSQLIVDETHEALLIANGHAADLFAAGRHTLSLPNIPLVGNILNLATGDTSPFPCKIFYINKVHQMNLLWGTQGPITLEDPLYDIFMHVMAHGSMSLSVNNSRKFMLKVAGFRDVFQADDLIAKFRSIISSHVKDCISKIMINGMLSYFMMNAHLFDLSNVIKERLDAVFEEYGVTIQYFNLETIEVPTEDYKQISHAKERRTSRMIEGYTWQEERQMMIAEKFAGNEGTAGGIGSALGGFMIGGTMGGSVMEIARNALSPESVPVVTPPTNANGTRSRIGESSGTLDVSEFLKAKAEVAAAPEASVAGKVCSGCGSSLAEHAKFCMECGGQAITPEPEGRACSGCGNHLAAGAKFCPNCGLKLQLQCHGCGSPLAEEAKFCMECGEKV